jgi:DNA-binding beta-propeller fold protein YncE
MSGKRRTRFIWPALFIISSLIAGLYSCSGVPGTGKEDPAPTATPLGKLYVSNSDGSVVVFDQALTAEGNIPPSRRFPEAITGPTGIFLDEANDILYVANTDHNSILIYEHASSFNPALGAALATHIISGTKTGLNKPFGVVYDAAKGRLYVVNKENSVSVFQAGCNDAAALNGNISPCQTLSGTATLLDFPRALALDTARDILYISNAGTNSILIYDNVSAPATQGNLPPTRIISAHSGSETDSILTLPFGLAVDPTNDRLYVVNTGRNRPAILIYENASARSGVAIPDRLVVDEVKEVNGSLQVVTSARLSQPAGVFISVAQDRLFVVNSNNTNNGSVSVAVFSQISTRCTNQIHLCHLSPDQSLIGTTTQITSPAGIAYDQDRDLIYIGNTGANNVLTFGLQGNLAPIKRNSGNRTNLEHPAFFFYDNSVDPASDIKLDRLYVVNFSSDSANPTNPFHITVFEDITTRGTAENPAETFSNTRQDWGLKGGANNPLDIQFPRAMYIDRTGDHFIVLTAGKLLVYPFTQLLNATPTIIPKVPNTSGSRFTLSVAPTAFNVLRAKSMAVDEARGEVYISTDCDAADVNLCNNQPEGNKILVYTLSTGTVTRTIAGPRTGIDRPFGLFLDTQRDILYVTNVPHRDVSGPSANTVISFDHASTVSGDTAPTRIISSDSTFAVTDKLSAPLAPFVNMAADRLFLLNKGQNAIFIFNHASTLNKPTRPDRIISGAETALSLSNPNDTNDLPAALFVDTARGNETIYVGQPIDPGCTVSCSRGAILVFGLNGNAPPSKVWSGGEAPIGGVSALAVDTSRDILYTANAGDPALLADDALFAFSNASTLPGTEGSHGNVCSPVAAVICPDTQLNNPAGIVIDSEKNRLYVSNSGTTNCSILSPATPCNTILVYHGADRLISFADSSPDQILSGTAINNPHGLALNTRLKTLYVANTGGNSVLVFKNVEALNREVTPDAEIGGVQSQINQPVGVAIDPERDILYVLNQGVPEILVFDSASTRNGNIAPSRVISGSGYMVKPTSLFLDTANNLLYVADQGTSAIYTFNNASGAQGAAEHKNLIGNNTGLNQPSALFVDTTR